MKGIAIGFSANSKSLLVRLLKTEFVHEVYIASKQIKNKKELGVSSSKLKKILRNSWKEVDLIIFVGSLSASVRLISSLLISKDKDPGVIVMDKNCSKIIPLIGLHQSNTENIAHQMSNLFDAEVITTNNSKNNELFSIDEFGSYWGWKKSGSVNDWSKLVISQSRNQQIYFKQTSGNKIWREANLSANISEINLEEVSNISATTFHISSSNTYKNTWHPPILWIGIGCERNTSKELIKYAIDDSLSSSKLSELSIAGFATIELKRDEKAILEIVEEKILPIKFYSPEELSIIKVPNPSNVVFQEMGTASVAEAACLIAAGEGGKLIKTKKIYKKEGLGAVTISIAESINQYAPHKGEIHIIGSGPGDLAFLTGDSRKALTKCSVWIGYKFYLDLLEPIRRNDQIRIDSKLTEEQIRCEKAIQLAEEGVKVAIISSGDAGIYGMAGLILEIINESKNIFKPSVEVHPGISSFQLAASIAGAPLMNDFCVVSLSDKLTPWEIIETRIEGALRGDFVVAILNPKSAERNWQLEKIINLFLNVREENTPVLIARQVGRENQSKKFATLSTIPFDEIDMFTLIIIGNSKTKLLGDTLVTLRGYL